ncbi:MAG: InlB B-repeat-containing protein [Oscillospiraceae bacterium]|nr:InlB B-repeat-containing protein [Oscillospiraceae bacterium]
MKRTLFPRTLLAVLLVLTMALSLFPMSAWAMDDLGEGERGDIFDVDDTMENNAGTVTINGGTVTNNNAGGMVQGNYGTVANNNAGGMVDGNYGTVKNNNAASGGKPDGQVGTNHEGALVERNYGTVTTNAGTIGTTDNGEPLFFTGNFGTVGTNASTGTITANHEGGTVTDNYGTVTVNDELGIVSTNYAGGKVETNNGEVGENHGTVTDNNGAISYNFEGATVVNSKGSIQENTGTIGQVDEDGNPVEGTGNFGFVEFNGEGGVIVVNHRFVHTNDRGGTITDNLDYVENNYGKIVNNYGGNVTNKTDGGGYTGTVMNQYSYGVQIAGKNAAAGAADGDMKLYADVYWLLDGASGSVTVTPKSGYTLAMPTLAEDAGAMSATGSESGGWTLSFTSLLKNVTLNLSAKLIKKPAEPAKPAAPVVSEEYCASVASIAVLQLVFEDGFGGSAVLSVPQGKPFALPDAPEHEGYSFLGWEAEIDGQTTVFAAGERIKLDKAVGFRALWASPTAEAGMKLDVRG